MWVKGRHQLGKLMMLLQSSKADIYQLGVRISAGLRLPESLSAFDLQWPNQW